MSTPYILLVLVVVERQNTVFTLFMWIFLVSIVAGIRPLSAAAKLNTESEFGVKEQK